MNIDRMIGLHSPIRVTTLLKLRLLAKGKFVSKKKEDIKTEIRSFKKIVYRVVKVPSRNRLLNRRDIIRVDVRLNHNFYTFTQSR